jgi:methionyl-tRNA formyltransferase
VNKNAVAPGAPLQSAHNLSVVFLGGKQAGCIGLLTVAAAGCSIKAVVAYDSMVESIAAGLCLPMLSSIKKPEIDKYLDGSDLLVSVHAPEIVPDRVLKRLRFGGVNTHPCLYRYKGANPVGRLLQDGCTKASVGVHRMTQQVDEGEVLAEEFVDVTGKKSVDEVYNTLYPYYSVALLKALQILNKSVRHYGNK